MRSCLIFTLLLGQVRCQLLFAPISLSPCCSTLSTTIRALLLPSLWPPRSSRKRSSRSRRGKTCSAHPIPRSGEFYATTTHKVKQSATPPVLSAFLACTALNHHPHAHTSADISCFHVAAALHTHVRLDRHVGTTSAAQYGVFTTWYAVPHLAAQLSAAASKGKRRSPRFDAHARAQQNVFVDLVFLIVWCAGWRR
jgi:hypothetical protein